MAVLKELIIFFFTKDSPSGPPPGTTNHQPLPTATNHQSPTANRQPPPTANCQLQTANRHQPPIANRQPPTATNHQSPTANRQPPPTANCQLQTANRHQPPIANRQPPTATNHQSPTANRQPPPTTNRQPPTATNRQPPPTANRHAVFLQNCRFGTLFFLSLKDRPVHARRAGAIAKFGCATAGHHDHRDHGEAVTLAHGPGPLRVRVVATAPHDGGGEGGGWGRCSVTAGRWGSADGRRCGPWWSLLCPPPHPHATHPWPSLRHCLRRCICG